MSGYARAKRIEIGGGSCALEILANSDGRAKFVLQHRFLDRPGHDRWTTIHSSGVYADAESAEADGLLRWRDLRKAWLGGMTANERLVLSGLIFDWDDAVRTRDRRRMGAILAEVELGEQATQIIDAALQRKPDR
jgi:hypothetical protein